MEKVLELANLCVASLRALYLIETQCHWLTRGTGFYGDHLLFERLYKQSQDDADAMAERVIGLFGEKAVDMGSQADYLSKLLHKYQGDDYHELALKMEQDFLEFAQQVFDAFEAEDVLSLGLNDLLATIADSHETAVSLLQQALDEE